MITYDSSNQNNQNQLSKQLCIKNYEKFNRLLHHTVIHCLSKACVMAAKTDTQYPEL